MASPSPILQSMSHNKSNTSTTTTTTTTSATPIGSSGLFSRSSSSSSSNSMAMPAAKMKTAAPGTVSTTASKANGAAKQKMQMHRRSRTGCYTCRLRRKKCDEGNPLCSACRNLGLRCDYKRPLWWSNNDQRRNQKDSIKMIIKRKKLTEKSTTSSQVMTPGLDTPPSLCYSLPTSASYSDSLGRRRSPSIDSQLSIFDFAPPSIVDYTTYNAQLHPQHAAAAGAAITPFNPLYPDFSPYEVDVKTERQMFVNDIPTRRESTISTFSTYHPPPPPEALLPSFPLDNDWTMGERKESSMTQESLNMNLFDFQHGPTTNVRSITVELEESDQRLLDHFVSDVLPGIFPILETNQHGSARTDYVLPALQSNRCYLHCCLSIAAQHYKATTGVTGEQIDADIMRHRYATISELCEALNRDVDHKSILEATLGMIFFQCAVGRFDDTLPDIPWHQHFQAAISLVQKLDLGRQATEPHRKYKDFNMTLTSWIDILGSTVQGRAPTFAHTYREKHLSPTNSSIGLRELMGCEDRVMYLISEIACLEALKKDGMDDIQLCQHVHALGDQIGLTELGEMGPRIPFNANGVLSPKQLSKNMTAAFRLAARIYLCSLVPGFTPAQDSCVGLVAKLSSVLEFIPSGLHGFDRSLVWVYLIGGAVSTAMSPFRSQFAERVVGLGELADHGSFGRVAYLLKEVWSHVDAAAAAAAAGHGVDAQYISWRDVMRMKGWEFLLI